MHGISQDRVVPHIWCQILSKCRRTYVFMFLSAGANLSQKSPGGALNTDHSRPS